MQLVMGRQDLARCRFALSPLWETVSAVRTLGEPDRQIYHRKWLERARSQVDFDLAPLKALLPRRGYTPDFLAPPPATQATSFANELRAVEQTPLDQVEREITRCLKGADRQADPVSPGVASLLLSDAKIALQVLVDILRRCWATLVAPQWPQLRDLLAADIGARSRQLTEGGLQRLLPDLHASILWHDGSIKAETSYTLDRSLRGQGLLMVPSAFIWPAMTVVVEPPWQPTLFYPARGVSDLWEPAPQQALPALQQLIGRTRAEILVKLAEPNSTAALARLFRLSPSTISEHLTALRNAGAIRSCRVGRTVLYERTPLGVSLVRASR
ncbi:transcriptional regulator [Pseudonocardia sp. TMWB2A]|uniref:ArsR/SmtB family transcription factor n=1 Tax=Pseudonocardia sp. TMWB2A TaxID=687430 RepID=UPI00307F8436